MKKLPVSQEGGYASIAVEGREGFQEGPMLAVEVLSFWLVAALVIAVVRRTAHRGL